MHENHAIRVTLIEPGMTDTPFFRSKKDQRLRSSQRHLLLAGVELVAVVGDRRRFDSKRTAREPQAQRGGDILMVEKKARRRRSGLPAPRDGGTGTVANILHSVTHMRHLV